MSHTHPPISPRFPHLLHGGDYNPEQWIDTPQVWDDDVRLMKMARCNVVSIGIFSWATLEPAEGIFEFAWLDRVIEKLSKGGVAFVLATPTGAKPNWLAMKYPEVRRVRPDGSREPQQGRHNHCYTSPLYREKTTLINTRLAERYGKHPSLLAWHVSNEYGGECHCMLCKQAFREWLRRRYESLDALNRAYWSRFWSHTYTDWSQIDDIDYSVHGLGLDWKRFVTDQTVDFMRHELRPLRELTPSIPATINMMGFYTGLNYWKFAPHIDFVSWDAYPTWHLSNPVAQLAAETAFTHDMNRSMKHRPFVLMESTPSQTNWTPVCPLKRPGMHKLASLQAVAHGSDAVMYFQWRKSRGSCEKFHGAVVDHVGHENTRVFREVTELGTELEKLSGVAGATTDARAAIIYDWENRWAIDMEMGPRNLDKNYHPTCVAHYSPLWKRGVAVDVNDMDQDLSSYRLVIAPMLYMLRPGVAEKIIKFVEAGGTFVTTYFTGYVDQTDLCFLGGFPGPVRKLLGIWAEELDAVPDGVEQIIDAAPGNTLGLSGEYKASQFCELIHSEGATVAATYASDFYSGRPAVTVNQFGKGKAIYIASRNEARFTDNLLGHLVEQLQLPRAWDTDLPEGVAVTSRADGNQRWIFLQNYTDKSVEISGSQSVTLPPWGVKVLKQ